MKWFWKHRQEAADEIQAHIDERADELAESGIPREDALQQARREFGNVMLLTESSREVWGWNWLDGLLQDLRYAGRQLRRAPVFTVFASAILGIGIGASAFMVGVVRQSFLPLTVAKGEELRQVVKVLPRGTGKLPPWLTENLSLPAFRDLSAHTTAFSGLACATSADVVTGFGNQSERAAAQFISGSYFQTLGLPVLLGRGIIAADDQPGAPGVVVLNYAIWRKVFGGDSSVLGETATINGQPFTIIGVLPRDFRDAQPGGLEDLKVPIVHYLSVIRTNPNFADARNWNACRGVGRLRREVSDEQARQQIESIIREDFRVTPSEGVSGDVSVRLRPVIAAAFQWTNDAIQALTMMALIATIILIELANILGLLLARAKARRQEIATRLSLGASRRRIIWQLLTESVLLAGIGGGVGVVLALALEKLILQPYTFKTELILNSPVVLVTAGLTIVAGIVFGLAPALTATRLDLDAIMRRSSPASFGGFRMGKVLVGFQVALSLLLLIGASLFIQTQMQSTGTILPSEVGGMLVFRVDPSLNGYDGVRSRQYLRDAGQSLAKLPGVISSSMLRGEMTESPAGQQVCLGDSNVLVSRRYIAPQFLATMKTPLLAGREFEWSDGIDKGLVAVVSEDFVMHGGPALGQSFVLGSCSNPQQRVTIVGITPQPPTSVLQKPTIYVPFWFESSSASPVSTFIIKTDVQSAAFIPAIQRMFADVDRNVSLFQIESMASYLDRAFWFERFVRKIVLFAGFTTLMLSGIGIFGVLSYFVNQRRSEIGIRMALGAQRSQVMRLVARESLLPVSAGLVIGLLGSFPLSFFLRTQVFQLRTSDSFAIIISAALILFAAVGASSIPAWHASRIDPMQSLRYD